MPPRAALQTSFSASSGSEEVACPLLNSGDGSKCRKRCLGDKRYRSMQEHIRRAHPEYYLAKLPATRESFELMINTPPHPVEETQKSPNNAPRSVQNHHNHHHSDLSALSPGYHQYDPALGSSSLEGYHALGDYDGGYHTTGDTEAASIYNNMQFQQRHSDEFRRGSLIPTAHAAQALASLQYHRPDSASADWPRDQQQHIGQAVYNNEANDLKPNFVDPALDNSSFMNSHSGFDMSHAQDQPLSSGLAESPPERDAIPSLHRSLSRSGQVHRQRKASLSQQARLPKHERRKSKELKRSSGDHRYLAVGRHGDKWADLLDAAAAESANEEDEVESSKELTPIPQSPYQSPQVQSRTSMAPPFGLASQFQSYQASPLNRALTPPSAADQSGLELQDFHGSMSSSNMSHQHHNSGDSGSQFQIMNPSSIDTNSSPIYQPNGSSPTQPEIYCAACRRLCFLKDGFACTNCICGICVQCFEALVDNQTHGRPGACSRCHIVAEFKPFNVDLK